MHLDVQWRINEITYFEEKNNIKNNLIKIEIQNRQRKSWKIREKEAMQIMNNYKLYDTSLGLINKENTIIL